MFTIHRSSASPTTRRASSILGGTSLRCDCARATREMSGARQQNSALSPPMRNPSFGPDQVGASVLFVLREQRSGRGTLRLLLGIDTKLQFMAPAFTPER